MKKMSIQIKLAIYLLQAVLILFIFLPLIFALVSSFRPLEDIYKYVRPLSLNTFFPEKFTLQAYIDIFTEFKYGIAVINSLIVAFVTVFVGVIINGMAGFAFAKFNFRGKNVIFMLVLLTIMVPFELMSFKLYNLMIEWNWINSFLALIVPSIPNGMVIFLFRQYYLGFPNYMLEAAQLDGLNWRQIFFRIVIPNSKPICISAGLILFIGQWESFLWPVLVTRTPNMYTIQIALNSFRTEFTQLWNNIFAASIIAFIIPILIILPLQHFFIEGITNSGSKD